MGNSPTPVVLQPALVVGESSSKHWVVTCIASNQTILEAQKSSGISCLVKKYWAATFVLK